MPNKIIDLGFTPRAWQDESYRLLKRFSILVVHRRGGKTVQAIMRLIHEALKCKLQRGRYAYLAPQLKQAKDIAWAYLKFYALKVPGTLVNESELWVEFPESAGLSGARIRLYGADDPDSLRGRYFDGIVLDEVAQVKRELWGEVLIPCLADRTGWILFIGTPHGSNLFSELYYAALQNQEWFARCYTIHDTHELADDEVNRMKAQMTPQQFRQEMLCDFSASDDNVLIGIEDCQAAQNRVLREEQFSFAPKILGVDVAWRGGDRSVIMQRQGLQSFKPIIRQGLPEKTFAGTVAQIWKEWGADACFVDNTGGYGGEVVSRLQDAGLPATAVVFSEKPYNPRFLNLRAEMWFSMAGWIKGGASIWKDSTLVSELTAPVYDNDNASNKLKLESKDDIRDRLGFSPDIGDALALTFAHPVYSSVEHGPLVRPHKAESDWDPYRDQ